MKTYSLAVCLYTDVTCLDYQGPLELIGSLSTHARKSFAQWVSDLPDVIIEPVYLHTSLDPLKPSVGPTLKPDMTYEEALKEKWDIILVPGGLPGKAVDPKIKDFIKQKGPDVQYLLTVCTGSWIVADTGLLDGKRATSNKQAFKMIVEDTKASSITWVPNARWVTDGNTWTGSGVTAGMDMAAAFMEHFIGKKHTSTMLNLIEYVPHQQDDDPFAVLL